MASEPFAEVALQLRGFQISQMLHIAAELRLADRVGDLSRTVAELAVESGANLDMLLRLCRAPAAFGIFSVDDDSRVSQTPQSSCLRSDATPTLHYAARYWGLPSNWATWGNLHRTIMTGEPSFPDRWTDGEGHLNALVEPRLAIGSASLPFEVAQMLRCQQDAAAAGANDIP